MVDPLTQQPDDVAVIEQKYGNEWRPLGYVGYSRPDSHIIDYQNLHGGGSVRIRNLESGYDYIIGEVR